ncbi:hypothetical protein L2E82_16152 [Cichorium intybus]|uniref:Uncharacterized protein n=1 Tax=Cichorium intybus TaxID=13427 RepID=A0ACB9F4Q3_CICIN|nr:hypothetical protein L2E82_16152 [Cichorium intybus]
MVEMVVEKEVVDDNTTLDLTTFDVFDNLESRDLVTNLVMSESIPSPDNVIETVVEEGGVDDNTIPEPTIFENFEQFESKDLVMSESIPSPDNASRSLLVPIHLLDDDQEDDNDDVVFENEKHNFPATHDLLMSVKLGEINTIDEEFRELCS